MPKFKHVAKSASFLRESAWAWNLLAFRRRQFTPYRKRLSYRAVKRGESLHRGLKRFAAEKKVPQSQGVPSQINSSAASRRWRAPFHSFPDSPPSRVAVLTFFSRFPISQNGLCRRLGGRQFPC